MFCLPDTLPAVAGEVYSYGSDRQVSGCLQVINYSGKFVAMTVAFALQSRISAIQSAALGGQIFARALLQLGRERGVVHLKEEDTYVDEAIAWTVTVLGATVNQPPASQPVCLSLCLHSLPCVPNFLQTDASGRAVLQVSTRSCLQG